MNNLLYLKICLVTIIFFLSCNKQTENTQKILENAKLLHTNEIDVDFLLGRPNQITIGDNRLVITDNIDEKALAFYDIKSGTFIGRRIGIGQGPNEVIPPLLLPRSSESEVLSIIQRQNGRYTEHNIPNLAKENFVPNRSLEFENIDRLTQTNSGFIVSGPYEEGSIRILDRVGGIIKSQNIYPHYINDLNQPADRYVYGQGHIAYNRKNDVLAFASYFTGEASFYKLVGDSLEILKNFDFSLPSELRNRIAHSTGSASLKDSDMEYFSDIYSTSNHFYLLYTGIAMKDKNSASNSYIFKFSKEGQLLDTYKTDKKIISFCVQDDDSKGYGVALSEDMDYILVEMMNI
ncbi:BF3164 family lipoprotein [Sphingobacterium pedocola]|nr:BF3164 family lipoprotein [Sphingobacterium pedocola]